jgi:hypothetical protein
MTGNTKHPFIACLLAALVARPGQHGVEFVTDQFFDELSCPVAYRRLDRIKPIGKKLGSRLRLPLRGISLHGSAGHGVVSGPALQRRMIRG